jgi:hypothetical protein
LRGFEGGWNVVDDDLNLNYKYATRLVNCYPDADGTIQVRRGVELFASTAAVLTAPAALINVEYFIDSIIGVAANGEIVRVLGDGSVQLIFSNAIAALLPGAPTGWSATEFVSFAKFNNKLILCNGIDKPLIIDDQFIVEYLQDEATGTNINVPICKYVTAINRYLVMAGDPLELDRVHISAKDAPGTWFGDPPPNDATRVDVGSVLGSSTIIRGIAPFRGKLLVFFAEGIVFGTLGNYDENGNHAPNFDDGIEGYGSISHRAVVTYGDDSLFMDLEGVASIKRTVLSTSFRPSRISDLVDPEIQATLSTLPYSTLEDRVFAVHNKRDAQFLLFVPNAGTVELTTETRVFVFNKLSDNQEAWAEFRGWNFTCGVRSLQGELFFGDASGNLWLYTGENDFVNKKVTPVVTGTPIEIDWETPWLDFSDRANSKHSKYISFDTRGESEFTVTMYVDELRGSDGDFEPALSTRFSAGEQGQFGSGPQPYGGGRNTSRKRLYAWPCKFQIAKFRFTGQASEGLAFVAMTLHYLKGGISR